MSKVNQIVKWKMGKNHASIRNQTIEVFWVDEENYAYGIWRSQLVASFHIDNGTWFVTSVNK